jgi:hypothetical protein
MRRLFEWTADEKQFAAAFIKRWKTSTKHHTSKAIYSLIAHMIGEGLGAGFKNVEGSQDFIMKSSVDKYDKMTQEEEIKQYAVNVFKLIDANRDKIGGPEMRAAISRDNFVKGFLLAYGYGTLQERELTNRGYDMKTLNEDFAELFDSAQEEDDMFPETDIDDDDEFDYLNDEEEGWDKNVSPSWDTYDDDGNIVEDDEDNMIKSEITGEVWEDEEDGGLGEFSFDEDDEDDEDLTPSPRDYIEEEEDYSDADPLMDSKDFEFDNTKVPPFGESKINFVESFEKIYTNRLTEGGKRKNMSQDTIDTFVHQLLLIPDPVRRQEVVDEIFKKIAEENAKQAERLAKKTAQFVPEVA